MSLIPSPNPTPRLLQGVDKWQPVDSIVHEGQSDESTALSNTGDHASLPSVTLLLGSGLPVLALLVASSASDRYTSANQWHILMLACITFCRLAAVLHFRFHAKTAGAVHAHCLANPGTHGGCGVACICEMNSALNGASLNADKGHLIALHMKQPVRGGRQPRRLARWDSDALQAMVQQSSIALKLASLKKDDTVKGVQKAFSKAFDGCSWRG